MIRLENIHKHFGNTIALNGLSLTVPTGETTVLLGQSGCGKSTLIRIINGLLSPDSGTVFIQGERLTSPNMLRMRRQMGYVIQEGGLFPHLTARQNVALMAEYLGWARDQIYSQIEKLAKLTKLEKNALDRFPLQLSGGQNQRVSLMRALMLDPAILLLDEPLAALDPMIRFELQGDLKEIFQNLSITVVLVTHDIAEAAHFSHRVVLMKDGNIVQQGTIRQMIENPAESFVSRFVQAQRTLLQSLSEEDS
jgi:osmoprotectant transport system ATP-binding protein